MAEPSYLASFEQLNVRSYLERPRRPYKKTLLMDSQIDAIFDPQGFLPWNGAINHQSCYYFEYNKKGLGADTAKRVAWPGVKVLTAVEASDFILRSSMTLRM
ncbi:hypothetical protein L6164_025411 [Bauhinia variegata]|uniref:Uncharacterized protein n=1 Tax=Bauhinia variegata TaxID=167791 RepID=A0ACB9M0F3_BAUVA|nr:hypothetical protein L6164_025411 [Bauhinia variegata]